MSILIKGMAMPKGCAFCKISRRNGKKMVCPLCFGRGEWDMRDPMSADHRLDGCPLIPVHDHGRLIDENALLKGCGYIIADGMACIPVKHIANAPTIIPADFAKDINVPSKEASDG